MNAVRRAPSDDTDRDGVPDTDDRCVTEPETRNGFRDDDGCPDVAGSPDDLDNDQIRGAADQCPQQPEDVDGYQDTDGCPEPDNDNDGVLDAQDQCGDQPETRNGFQDEDGCPDTGGGAAAGGGSIALPGPVDMDGRGGGVPADVPGGAGVLPGPRVLQPDDGPEQLRRLRQRVHGGPVVHRRPLHLPRRGQPLVLLGHQPLRRPAERHHQLRRLAR